MKKIAVTGANPARQKTLVFNSFVRGEVNRAAEKSEFPSGKGINFCRAARCFGAADTELFQFCGGENGKFIISELEKALFDVRSVITAGETRCCITALDRSESVMTELIEPSVAVSESEADEFCTLFERCLPGVDAVAICGTLPDGSDPGIYQRICCAATAAGLPILLDACKDVETLLESGNVFLKINRQELEKLSGEADIECGLKKIFSKYPVRYAGITDGASRAYATDGNLLIMYDIPELPEVVNPIGCGDTAGAVWMSGMLNGMDFAEAFNYALGAATANAATMMPGSFFRSDAVNWAGSVKISFKNLL
jgi:tagatose 6-phosphate kinase